MDINSYIQGVGSLLTLIPVLKQIIDQIPNDAKKAKLEADIEKAEQDFKMAQAVTAKSLGYKICHNHFPPVIMLSKDDANWECPECHSKKYVGARSYPGY